MDMVSPVVYVSKGDIPHKNVTCQSDFVKHSILKPKERALTAPPIFISTKYSFSILVYMSQRIVPRTENSLE
jgi:hypothetical protein